MGMSADLEAAVFGGVDLLQIAGFRHRIYKYSLTGIPDITAQQ